MMRLFAVATPGLEPILRDEVAQLPGVQEVALLPGGVEFAGQLPVLMDANLRLRTASRVLLRLAGFRATRLSELIRRAQALPWERYLRPAQVVQIRVSCHKSRIYHSGAAAERVALGIAQRLGAAPADGPAAEAPLVVVRGVADEWEVSIDTSGELLHRRGYRRDHAAAPLRETLAAGLLLLGGYQGGPLLDLCCGTGTFLIEAALIRRRRAPGLHRRFAFLEWPDCSVTTWQSRLDAATALADATAASTPLLCGLDIAAEAVASAQRNVERAGVTEDVTVRRGDLFRLPSLDELLPDVAPAACLIVANPPYGKRLRSAAGTGDNPVVFYRRLGRLLRSCCAGHPVLILCPEPTCAQALALGLPITRVRHGGLPLAVVHGMLPAAVESRHQRPTDNQSEPRPPPTWRLPPPLPG